MERKRHSASSLVRPGRKYVERSARDSATDSAGRPSQPPFRPDSRLISLRHHSSLWLTPVALLILAFLPWPYGFYNLLRLIVCVVSAWLAYEQWKHDDAVSGWVVALSTVALLYNPLLPIHLTREIWMVLNLVTVGLFLGHLRALKILLTIREQYPDLADQHLSTSSSHAVGRPTSSAEEPPSQGSGSV